MSQKKKSFLLYLLAFLPLIIWASAYINQDLWYDEVFSFEQFVFQDWNTTVTDYSAPNNHIFHNLILQLFSRSIGVRDAMELPSFIFLFRILELFISLGTAYYLLKLGSLLFSQTPRYLILLCLFSSLAFANYQIQIRGYALSCLLLTASSYYAFSVAHSFSLKRFGALAPCSFFIPYHPIFTLWRHWEW